MRLKSILKLHQLSKNLGFVLALLLCLRVPFCRPSLQKKGFSEVADWNRVQESLKWTLFLAGFAEFWASCHWQT